MSSDYVRSLFNGYANRFDKELCEVLQYKGHFLVADAAKNILLQKEFPKYNKFQRVIDLGCGTGLAGIPLLSLISVKLQNTFFLNRKRKKSLIYLKYRRASP